MPTTTNTMGSISMMEATLPPGFRFHPRDEELVSDYLAKRLAGDGSSYPSMIDVDLNKCEPWDLPGLACVGGKEWYFFSLRDRKYATGQRTNRATLSGYWKATGKDRQVVSSRRGTIVGMRKTLVFYQGRAPKGKKTDWVMHEFRMEWPTGDHPRFSLKEDWVLCRVFYKSRGTSSRPSNETCFDDTGSSLADSHLPDTQHITFDHTQHSLAGYGQVPCFSNVDPPPPSHRRPTQLVAHPSVAPSLRIPAIMGQAHLGEFPDLGSCLMDQLPCDKSVARAGLYHFNKLESNQKMEPDSTLGEGSLERYLSETGQQSLMWNTF